MLIGVSYILRIVTVILQNAIENARKFFQAGGRIAIGTDSMFDFQFANAGIPVQEMRWLYEAGLDMQSIVTAGTLNAAYVSRLDQRIGTIEDGKKADIIAIKGALDSSFHAFEHVDFVMNKGTIIKAPEE